jgi:hypothetical protein
MKNTLILNNLLFYNVIVGLLTVLCYISILLHMHLVIFLNL